MFPLSMTQEEDSMGLLLLLFLIAFVLFDEKCFVQKNTHQGNYLYASAIYKKKEKK